MHACVCAQAVRVRCIHMLRVVHARSIGGNSQYFKLPVPVSENPFPRYKSYHKWQSGPYILDSQLPKRDSQSTPNIGHWESIGSLGSPRFRTGVVHSNHVYVRVYCAARVAPDAALLRGAREAHRRAPLCRALNFEQCPPWPPSSLTLSSRLCALRHKHVQ